MGTAVTVNIVGRSQSVEYLDEAGEPRLRWIEVYAQTALEMAQKAEIMRRAGTPVVEWYAQTARGARILKARPFHLVPASEVPMPRTVTCPICGGVGNAEGAWCPVCSGSGITAPGHWRKWLPSQLEEFRSRFKGLKPGEVTHVKV